jgi:twinkle protein
LRDGKLIRWKSRDINDKHKCRTSSDSQPCLFGWQAIPRDAREVVICEGEIDSASWYQLGYPALSVPNGAQGHNWIADEYHNLDRFEKIYLSMDMDDAGQKAIPEIVDRLGRERVYIVTLPDEHKDANDLLVAGYADAKKLIENAQTLDPEEIRQPKHYLENLIDEFWSDEEIGYTTPWSNVGDNLRFRPGETIVLAGINKHGKSQLVGHISLHAMKVGEKICVASMEFKPVKWLKRLTRQASGVMKPAPEYIKAIAEWYQDKLVIFDVVGTAKVDRMINAFEYARYRYGTTTFIIDNLQKCGVKLTDDDEVKDFIDRLGDFAKEHDCTVFIVHHMRKGADESNQGKMGIKGSGAITDMVDTILIIWRDKKKELARHRANRDGEHFDDSASPDVYLYCEGQRNGESEPTLGLWFDKRSNQYLQSYRQKPYQYVDYSSLTNVVQIGKDDYDNY